MNSIFDIYSIGIGPSSSHTSGPMKAAYDFGSLVIDSNKKTPISSVSIELFGSLAFTGIAHGTDKALLMGLSGFLPDSIDPSFAKDETLRIKSSMDLLIKGSLSIKFDINHDLILNTGDIPDFHSNAMNFKAFDTNNKLSLDKTYYSVGGGAIVSDSAKSEPANARVAKHSYSTATELLDICSKYDKMIWEIALENEKGWFNGSIANRVTALWDVMNKSIDRGLNSNGILDGGLNVKRRAPGLYKSLSSIGAPSFNMLEAMDYVNVYAIAVNEENASGGTVVTAPTNGAAGIVPAVIKYCDVFIDSFNVDKLLQFFLTSGVIADLYKRNASISGAEVGCQGEVGVACSMAAGGLTAVLGGSNSQIENAAEVAMEHNLGLTCDPIKGLVQIPCIERNAMGAVKAINAARIAMNGTGEHRVSLDQIIQTMYDTGKDMQAKYKETSEGGLAVNVVEC